jgi:hypothetical protein
MNAGSYFYLMSLLSVSRLNPILTVDGKARFSPCITLIAISIFRAVELGDPLAARLIADENAANLRFVLPQHIFVAPIERIDKFVQPVLDCPAVDIKNY